MNYLKTFLPYLFGNKKGKSLDISLPTDINWPSLRFEETLMFHTLSNSLNTFVSNINIQELSRKDRFHLFNFLEHLSLDLKEKVIGLFQNDYKFFLESVSTPALSINELQELLDFTNNKLTVFALLKKNRTQKGVLIIRTSDGLFLKDSKSSIWSIPILGLSGRGLPFNHSNGCTPTGVYTIDSVMPEADKNYEFGKYRRLIVNFIKESSKESEFMSHLPRTHHQLNWWKSSLLARELGRSLLRIHGTGRRNFNPISPYFPLVPTSGCLATNETIFTNDQRLLLDALIDALGLPKNYESESKIHGLLYVVEFNDSLSTLKFN